MSKLIKRHFALALVLASITVHAKTIRLEGLASLQELRTTDDGGAHAQRLLITDHTGATVLDTDKALPRIENAYSPDSYDGYMADLVAERQGKSAVTDLQGERQTLLFPLHPGGRLPAAHHPRRR